MEEYLDGELESHDARRARAHVLTCGGCAGEYEELAAAQEFLLSNQRVVRVRPELWAAVHEKLGREKAGVEARVIGPQRLRERWAAALKLFSLSWATGAAALLLALGAGVAVRLFINAPNGQPSQQTLEAKNSFERSSPPARRDGLLQTGVAEESAAKAPETVARHGLLPVAASDLRKKAGRRVPATNRAAGGRMDGMERTRPLVAEMRPLREKAVREIEQRYLETISLLSRDAGARRSLVGAESLTSYDEALSVIDRAIDTTRRAVREQPGDLVAVQYMMSAYGKKVELLRGLADYKAVGGN
jgi:hypothetical protein